MILTRLGSYTVSEIDQVLQAHPLFSLFTKYGLATLPAVRYNIYNTAQEAVHKFYIEKDEILSDLTISDNKITYSTSPSIETIYEYSSQNIEERKESLYSLSEIDSIVRYSFPTSTEFSSEDRNIIYNLAAQALSNFHNSIGSDEYTFTTTGYNRYAAKVYNRYSTINVYPIISIKTITTNNLYSMLTPYPRYRIIEPAIKEQYSMCTCYPIATLKQIDISNYYAQLTAYPLWSVS